MLSKIAWSLALYSARKENAHVKYGWPLVSYSIQPAQKTYMLS